MIAPEDLSRDQAAAWDAIHHWWHHSNDTEFALAGAAGTGKTYLLRHLLTWAAQTGIPVHLTATTNKAARVAAALADSDDARTIHSVLGLKPVVDDRAGRQKLKRQRPPRVDRGALVIVDEASMVDRELLGEIREAARAAGARVLYVGDAYQLPPVFAMEAPVFALVPRQARLTTVHRQAAGNPIIEVATQFREVLDGGPFPRLAEVVRNGKGVKLVTMEEFGEVATSLFLSQAYQEDPDYVRLLAWTNRRVQQFNGAIRSMLLGTEDETPRIGERLVVNTAVEANGNLILGTDDVVTVRNIAEGHLHDLPGWRLQVATEERPVWVFVPRDWTRARALLSELRSDANRLQRLMATDPSVDRNRRNAWRLYFDIQNSFADLRSPHASTVHKSQGSTYTYTLIDLTDIGRNTRWSDIARLCYVAITRASDAVFITGQLPERVYSANRETEEVA